MSSVYIVRIPNCFQKKSYLYRNALFKHIKSFWFRNIFLFCTFVTNRLIFYVFLIQKRYKSEYGQCSKHTAKMKVFILLSVLSLIAGEYDYIYKTLKLNLTKNHQLLSNRGTFNGFDE